MPNLIVRSTRLLTGRKFLVGHKRIVQTPAIIVKNSLAGKTVWFESDDGEVAGVVKSIDGGDCIVQLALPNGKGLLSLCSTEIRVKQTELREEPMVIAPGTVKAWSLTEPFDTKMTEVKGEGGKVVDYLDVFVEGLASTFAKVTPSDRDGDYVAENAFDATLSEFRRNPVMLMDHKNSVHSIAGSFDKIGVIDKGLAVRGRISNAPELAKIRFLIAEKHLQAFSMGGFFSYGADGRAINKVDLYEVSLVAVPANQDALFSVRSPTLEEARKMFKKTKALGLGLKAA